MSHACLLPRPAGSLISALSTRSAISTLPAEKSTDASWAVDRAIEWHSSDPTRPAAGRGGAARTPAAELGPTAGVAIGSARHRGGSRKAVEHDVVVEHREASRDHDGLEGELDGSLGDHLDERLGPARQAEGAVRRIRGEEEAFLLA